METSGFDGVLMDVTGNCNLRCPYCVTEFEGIKGNLLMTPELFDKAFQLAPLLKPEADFMVSCGFEPTLHPHFPDLLERIPKEHRGQVAFTTNLARRLDDSYLERLAKSGIRYVNISVDSWVPSVFEELRKGARFDRFEDNLRRLVKVFSSRDSSPEVRLITVVCRRNVREVPELVEFCAQELQVDRHEVRPFWFTNEVAERDWAREQAITQEEFLSLRRDIQGLSSPPHIGYDLPFNPVAFFPFAAWRPGPLERMIRSSGSKTKEMAYSNPFDVGQLRITSDGLVRFVWGNPETFFELGSMEDPYPFFSSLLEVERLSSERARLLRASTEKALSRQLALELDRRIKSGQIDFIENPSETAGAFDALENRSTGPGTREYNLTGWARNPSSGGPADKIVIIGTREGRRFTVAAEEPRFERFDVWEVFQDTRLVYTGWKIRLGQVGLQGTDPVKLAAYAVDLEAGKAYRLEGDWEVPKSRIQPGQ
jgi:pyruvate-formate lyase-activating enzyme